MIQALKRLFTEELTNLILLNLLTVVLCLPVFTIGPALMALNGTILSILDDRCHRKVWEQFRQTFLSKFRVGLLYEILVAGYCFLLLYCQSLGTALGDAGEPVLVLTAVIGFFAAMVSVTTLQIAAGVRQSFWVSLWNGVLLALGRFPQALLSTLVVYGMLAAAYLLYPISLVPAIVILVAVTAAVSISCLWPSYQALVLEPCDQ